MDADIEEFARDAAPDWSRAGKVHDWRNYIGNRVRAAWASLSAEQRIAIALDAAEIAGREDWE